MVNEDSSSLRDCLQLAYLGYQDIPDKPNSYTHTQFIYARRLSRKGNYHCSSNTRPIMCRALLRAHTWFLSVYIISDVSIVAGRRGLVILPVEWREGASSSVQNPILSS